MRGRWRDALTGDSKWTGDVSVWEMSQVLWFEKGRGGRGSIIIVGMDRIQPQATSISIQAQDGPVGLFLRRNQRGHGMI
jgi:hypothetical protein